MRKAVHSEFEKISKYVIPPSNRKLTLLLMLLSALVTLLTIWFLPILDHLFPTFPVHIKTTPMDLIPFKKPKVPKVYQEPSLKQSSNEKLRFVEALPNVTKQVVNPKVILTHHFSSTPFDLQISTDLSFNIPNQKLGLSGLNLGELVFNLNQVDERPIALNKLKPHYPFRARRRGIEGEVLLSFVITEAGFVNQVKVLHSEPPGTFDRFAENAVKMWKFKPAKKDGRNVSVLRKQLVKFGLKK